MHISIHFSDAFVNDHICSSTADAPTDSKYGGHLVMIMYIVSFNSRMDTVFRINVVSILF